MRISCCKDCPDRSVGCHAECERYIQEKAEYDEQKALILERKKEDNAVRDAKIKAFERMFRK